MVFIITIHHFQISLVYTIKFCSCWLILFRLFIITIMTRETAAVGDVSLALGGAAFGGGEQRKNWGTGKKKLGHLWRPK